MFFLSVPQPIIAMENEQPKAAATTNDIQNLEQNSWKTTLQNLLAKTKETIIPTEENQESILLSLVSLVKFGYLLYPEEFMNYIELPSLCADTLHALQEVNKARSGI